MNELTLKCIAVANYIIEKINDFNRGKVLRQQIFLTTRRLQKLLYFCYVDYMVQNNGALLFEDKFTVWPSGPAIKNVYREYMQMEDGPLKPKVDKPTIKLTEDIKVLIDNVLEKTQSLNTTDLIKTTKIVDGPWEQIYDNNDENYDKIIPREKIYEFYSKKEKKKHTKKFIIYYSVCYVKGINHIVIFEETKQDYMYVAKYNLQTECNQFLDEIMSILNDGNKIIIRGNLNRVQAASLLDLIMNKVNSEIVRKRTI